MENLNNLLKYLSEETNVAYTENGAKAYKTTNSAVLDFFSHAGAMRASSEQEITNLFVKAYSEDPLLALKALFYLRDVRGGQGERRLFRAIIKYMASYHASSIKDNVCLIPEYGRFDDILSLLDTDLEGQAVVFINQQIAADLKSENPSLAAKWLPSINASSKETRKLGLQLSKKLHLSERQYRKILSILRKRIGLVEQKMSSGYWSTIDYPTIPSRAGMVYRNAFLRHDPSGYQKFINGVNNGTQKMNAGTLYPHEIASKFMGDSSWSAYFKRPEDWKSLEAMWKSLPDYLEGSEENAIAVVDTSGSMTWGDSKVKPISVALSLGLYFAERIQGAFHNNFITFSRRPELQKITGSDLYEKFSGMNSADWDGNTDVEAVFNLILGVAVKNRLPQSDLPSKIFIFSDMEFDASRGYSHIGEEDRTLFESIKNRYRSKGYKMPELVFWNLSARHNQFPVKSTDYGMSLVSGFSPSIMKNLLAGKDMTPYSMMMEILNSERYAPITVSK